MQESRRPEAAWQKGSQVSVCVLAEVCWPISAKPFSFPATLLGGSNKQPAPCFPHYCLWIPRSLWKCRGNIYIFESRVFDSFWLLARRERGKDTHVPSDVFVISGSRLALRDTLTSPLALAISWSLLQLEGTVSLQISRAGELRAYLSTEY